MRIIAALGDQKMEDGALTVIDPAGFSVKIPLWMTFPQAAQHLARKVLMYLRQSSEKQVKETVSSRHIGKAY